MSSRKICSYNTFEEYVFYLNSLIKDHVSSNFVFFGKACDLVYNIEFKKTKDIDILITKKDFRKLDKVLLENTITKKFGNLNKTIKHDYGKEYFFENIEIDVWNKFPGYASAESFVKNKQTKRYKHEDVNIPCVEDIISLKIGVEKRKGIYYLQSLVEIYKQEEKNIDYFVLNTYLKSRYRLHNGRLIIPEVISQEKNPKIVNLYWHLENIKHDEKRLLKELKELKWKVDNL